jgi:glutathione S-transferase
MILYDVTAAPNPRRVRIFAAEKNITLEYRQVDMTRGEHKSPDFLARHPSGKVPALQTDDGQYIGESVAICRYLEALHPEPNLFGRTPMEQATVEMYNRIMEFELWSPIGTSWVNGPVVAKMAPGRFKQIPEAKAASDAATHRFYDRLDKQLTERSFIAGERFTVADITALTAVDFATSMVDLRPGEGLENLWRWHADVSARPSAAA